MNSLIPVLGLVFAGAAYAGGNPVFKVHRCVSDTGALSYQQQPCAPDSRDARLLSLDLRAPLVPPESRPARGSKASKPLPRTARKTRSRQPGRGRAAAIPDCPATREHPGDSGLGSVKTAWKRQIELPGETYLKNAGRWPRQCIRR